GMVVFTAATAGEPPEPAEASASPVEHTTVDVMATLSGDVESQTLLKADGSWDGTPYAGYPAGRPEITVVRLSIPPHTVLPWHSHSMPNAAYVVSGSIQVEKQSDGKRRTLTTGEVLAEMVDSPHRGMTGDEPAVLMVFYAGVPNMPLSTAH